MRIEQISVFLENKQGQLSEVIRRLAEAGINIRALSLADTERFGILRLITPNPESTVQTLKDMGVTVALSRVLAVEVPDRAGGLSWVLGALERQEINLEYMYAVVQGRNDKAILVMKLDDMDRAIEALRSAGIYILTAKEVSAL